jgi:hypothetical protein
MASGKTFFVAIDISEHQKFVKKRLVKWLVGSIPKTAL